MSSRAVEFVRTGCKDTGRQYPLWFGGVARLQTAYRAPVKSTKKRLVLLLCSTLKRMCRAPDVACFVILHELQAGQAMASPSRARACPFFLTSPVGLFSECQPKEHGFVRKRKGTVSLGDNERIPRIGRCVDTRSRPKTCCAWCCLGHAQRVLLPGAKGHEVR